LNVQRGQVKAEGVVPFEHVLSELDAHQVVELLDRLGSHATDEVVGLVLGEGDDRVEEEVAEEEARAAGLLLASHDQPENRR
jgi:hypothetical protein